MSALRRVMPLVVASLLAPGSIPASARWLVCAENAVVLRDGAEGLAQLLTSEEIDRLGIDRALVTHVGSLDDTPLFATAAPSSFTASGFELVGLRALWSRLDESLFALAGRANQLVHFRSTHRFCGRCGAENVPHERERAMQCSRCALVAYPRISPAIITLVRRGDQALLARSARFPIPMFSTLAGFAEIGESLEETLAREVREEVGVEVTNVRYFGSQPWPFPSSLMIAFTADYTGGEIRVDGDEIREARFFDATSLPRIPPKLSIARALIDAWATEVTGAPVPE